MSGDDKMDIILFGATGFTGRLALEYLLTSNPTLQSGKKLSFGICGRNEEKLKTTLEATILKVRAPSSSLSTRTVIVTHTGEEHDR